MHPMLLFLPAAAALMTGPLAARHLADAVGCSLEEARRAAVGLRPDIPRDNVHRTCTALKAHLSLSTREMLTVIAAQPEILDFSSSDLNFWVASQRLAEWQQPGLRGSAGNFLGAQSPERRAAIRRSPNRQTGRHRQLATVKLWRAEQALHDAVDAAGASYSASAAAKAVRHALGGAEAAGVPHDAPQRRRAVGLLCLLEQAAREEAEAKGRERGVIDAEATREAKLRAIFEEAAAGSEDVGNGGPTLPRTLEDAQVPAAAAPPVERYHYRYVTYARPRAMRSDAA